MMGLPPFISSHKKWLTILAITFLLLGGGTPALEAMINSLDRQQTTLATENAKLERQIYNLREDAKTARELRQTLSDQDVAALLSSPDRTAMTGQMEALAAAARLSNVVYHLSSPEPWHGDSAFPGIQNITQSRLTLEADAPNDSDLFTFIESLRHVPGRIAPELLEITRLFPKEEKVRALNLHLKLSGLWLTNDPDGGP